MQFAFLIISYKNISLKSIFIRLKLIFYYVLVFMIHTAKIVGNRHFKTLNYDFVFVNLLKNEVDLSLNNFFQSRPPLFATLTEPMPSTVSQPLNSHSSSKSKAPTRPSRSLHSDFAAFPWDPDLPRMVLSSFVQLPMLSSSKPK